MAIKLAHQQAKAPTDGKDVSTRDYVDTASGPADDLTTTGADVNVSGAAPPSAGEVLTANDATSASWQAPAAAADIAVKVSGADTTSGNLAAKIAAGTNVSLAILNPGANEQLEITSANAVHALGSVDHSADTLANLNLKISDATLIDTTDSRLSDARVPITHSLGGSEHGSDTLANLNLKVSDATLAALDVSQQYTKNQYSAIATLTDGANVAYLASNSNIYRLTATNIGTRQLDNPTGIVAGMTWQVWFFQDPTNGLEAMTFDTYYDWGDEGAPDFTAQVVGIKNIITCVAFTTTQIGATVLKGFAA